MPRPRAPLTVAVAFRKSRLLVDTAASMKMFRLLSGSNEPAARAVVDRGTIPSFDGGGRGLVCRPEHIPTVFRPLAAGIVPLRGWQPRRRIPALTLTRS